VAQYLIEGMSHISLSKVKGKEGDVIMTVHNLDIISKRRKERKLKRTHDN